MKTAQSQIELVILENIFVGLIWKGAGGGEGEGGNKSEMDSTNLWPAFLQ